MTVKIMVGDVRAKLKELADESVHCVVTSPPYFGLRSYLPEGHPDKHLEMGAESSPSAFVAALVAVFREARRVLRKDGTVWLNIGDSYSSAGGSHDDREDNQSGVGAKRVWRDGSGRADGVVDERGQRNRNGISVNGLRPKNLIGIPWRLAFALQDDGWFLRQDIIWSKPNPMPESVTDRCTKSHEYLFLLSRSPQYYYDAEAIAEPSIYAPGNSSEVEREKGYYGGKWLEPPAGTHRNDGSFKAIRPTRNKRSVWEIATAPYADAHFATFPPALVEPCIRAGTSERGVCVKCAAPWERISDAKLVPTSKVSWGSVADARDDAEGMGNDQGSNRMRDGHVPGMARAVETVGWYPSCACYGVPRLPVYPSKPPRGDEAAFRAWEAACVPIRAERAALCAATAGLPVSAALVCDPYGGAATTGMVADRLGRDGLLIELFADYAEMRRRRVLGDSPLFTEVA